MNRANSSTESCFTLTSTSIVEGMDFRFRTIQVLAFGQIFQVSVLMDAATYTQLDMARAQHRMEFKMPRKKVSMAPNRPTVYFWTIYLHFWT